MTPSRGTVFHAMLLTVILLTSPAMAAVKTDWFRWPVVFLFKHFWLIALIAGAVLLGVFLIHWLAHVFGAAGNEAGSAAFGAMASNVFNRAMDRSGKPGQDQPASRFGPYRIEVTRDGRRLEGLTVTDVQLRRGLTIGRDDSTCDIGLNDATVSRIHARLHLSDTDRLQIMDLESLNGVQVSGTRIDVGRWVDIAVAAEVQIGLLRMRVLN